MKLTVTARHGWPLLVVAALAVYLGSQYLWGNSGLAIRPLFIVLVFAGFRLIWTNNRR